MAYAIEHDETVRVAIGRIMRELVVRAREQLLDPELSTEKRVHEARKRFKEARAVIRLVRDPLGEDLYRFENAWFRDAGRALADVRDADATIAALKKLDLDDDAHERAKIVLEQQQKHPPVDLLIAKAARDLQSARARIALWPRMRNSFETLAPGLLRAYRGGRRAMRRAESDAEIHEWRKRAKTHWYHVQLLQNVAPPVFDPYEDVMHQLSQLLGDHHDMTVLGERLSRNHRKVLAAIRKKKKNLESEAREIGTNVYVRKPNVWLEDVRERWNAWR